MDTAILMLGLLGCSFVAGIGLTCGALAILWIFGGPDEADTDSDSEPSNGGGW